MPGFRYRGGAGGYFRRSIKRAIVRGDTPLIGNERTVLALLGLILATPCYITCLALVILSLK